MGSFQSQTSLTIAFAPTICIGRTFPITTETLVAVIDNHPEDNWADMIKGNKGTEFEEFKCPHFFAAKYDHLRQILNVLGHLN